MWKIITANSAKESALSIVEAALAKVDAGVAQAYQPNYAFAA